MRIIETKKDDYTLNQLIESLKKFQDNYGDKPVRIAETNGPETVIHGINLIYAGDEGVGLE